MVGPAGVGKTSIVSRMNGQEYNIITECTVGCAFSVLTFDDQSVEVWDTAGQEKYKSLGPIYYRNAGILIFTFDVSIPTTIEDMIGFIEYFYQHMPAGTTDGVKIIVVGNKTDRYHQPREYLTSRFQIHPLIKLHQLDHIEPVYVSASSGHGIQDLIDKISKTVSILSGKRIDLEMINEVKLEEIHPALTGGCC